MESILLISFSDDNFPHSISLSTTASSRLIICEGHSVFVIDLEKIEKRENMLYELVQTQYTDIFGSALLSESEWTIGATLDQDGTIQCLTSTQNVFLVASSL